ncbi:MAG TPA: hypothetical protein VJI32_00750 [Candidatus Nanoarchaeia archaeon]|nr:hypothetical protein [Candidatus Nanoarchaeia archaeon]
MAIPKDLAEMCMAIAVNSSESKFYERGLDGELDSFGGYEALKEDLKMIVIHVVDDYSFVRIYEKNSVVYAAGMSFGILEEESVDVEIYDPGIWENHVRELYRRL